MKRALIYCSFTPIPRPSSKLSQNHKTEAQENGKKEVQEWEGKEEEQAEQEEQEQEPFAKLIVGYGKPNKGK